MKAKHIDCSLEEYHARAEWSRSQIETLIESPPLFHGRYIIKPQIYPNACSTALDTGTVAHQCLSAPGSMSDIVAEIPCEVLNAQGHRKGTAWNQWSKEHADKIQLKAEELEPIRRMVANVYAHPIAARLLQHVLHQEFTVVWHDSDSGLDLRARPDLIVGHRDVVLIPDFKTTRALTPREFVNDAVRFGYHRQAAWYSEGVAAFGYAVAGFVFITVHKSPAHECRIYELPERALQFGREQNQANRRDLARRLETNDWTDPYGKECLSVDLPDWVYEDAWRM